MTELNWIATRDGAAAPGEVFTYRVHVTGWGRIKLARIDRAVSAADDVSAIIAEIMRTSFDLGTYPRGRVQTGIGQAKAFAQDFENGHGLPGQPEWQQETPDRMLFLGVGHRHPHTGPERATAQPWELTEDQAAELLAKFKARFPKLDELTARALAPAYADEGLAPGTDATAEHLAMTGQRLREHLDASPAAQPERGHGVPRLAEQAVAGHHGDGDPLRDLHVRRHSYTTLEGQA
jgi:hypothetical protein